MIIFYKNYMAVVYSVAILVSLLVMNIMVFVLGIPIAGSLGGVFLSFGVLVAATLIGTRIANNKVNEKVDGWLSAYNNDCDPKSFIDQSQELIPKIQPPYGEAGAWFLSFYGQALLEVGDLDGARKIEAGVYESVKLAKKSDEQVAVIVNFIPLAMKLLGPEQTILMIDQGLSMIGPEPKGANVMRKTYLEDQRALAQAKIDGDSEWLIKHYRATRNNVDVPVRLRVEKAWDEAGLHYQAGNAVEERECLQFVADRGGKLSLARLAADRLRAL